MLKIGITGQAGFIGKHLYNTIGFFPSEFTRVDFRKSFFSSDLQMDDFVNQCDVIVHLAAMNRSQDPRQIYDTNIELVKKLVASLIRCKSKAHLLFSSSTQEERDNLYGKSKIEGRKIFSEWARQNEGRFIGLVIPNVFGPFGKPYYNSAIATFCHQLAHNEVPAIDVDSNLKLIYIEELVKFILNCIRKNIQADRLEVPYTYEARVSVILALLEKFHNQYQLKNDIFMFHNSFEYNLFNTYRCYLD